MNYVQTPKESKRNRSYFPRRIQGHAEVRGPGGPWQAVALAAVHIGTHQLSIVEVLCPEPPFRAGVFIFPWCWECWQMSLLTESLSSYCPWHKRVVLPEGKPLP